MIKQGRPSEAQNFKPVLNRAPNQIRKYRLKAGMSQTDLARRVGMSRDGIAMLEKRGNRPRNMSVARDMAVVLHTTVEKLLGIDTETPWVPANFYLPQRDGLYLCAFQTKYSRDYRYKTLFFRATEDEWRHVDGCGALTPEKFSGKVLFWMDIPEPEEYN